MKSSKHYIKIISLIVMVVCCQTVLAGPVGTAFTYQGKLLDENIDADGVYDILFKLYDGSDVQVANQIGSTTIINDVNVSNGYFDVILNFGSSAFNGDERWLEIAIRRGEEIGNYEYLTPLQAITPTPYAMYALNSGSGSEFWAANGENIYKSNPGNVGIGTESPTASLDVYTDARHHGIKSTTTGYVPIYAYRDSTTGTFPAVHGESDSASNGTSAVRGILNSNESGVNAAGVYGHNEGTTANGIGVRGLHDGSGVGVLGECDDGRGVLGTSRNGFAGYFSGPKSYFSGNVGIGTTNPLCRLSVGGEGNLTDTCSIYATGQEIGLYGSGSNKGVWGVCSGDSGGNYGVYGFAASYSDNTVYGVRGEVNRVGTGNYYSGYFSDTASNQGSYFGLYADERTGAAIDLAEYILDTNANTEPGDVLVADPYNDESIIKASIPYDATVVGIVSTQPHLLMGMELVMDETTGEMYEGVNAAKLALAGRVPVKVTNENGPIQRGDMLTTSSKTGYAMRWTLLDVTEAQDFEQLKSMIAENERRRNAIVAKALENSESEDGTIMALVTLQ